MAEALPTDWHGDTRHWQMLHLLDSARDDMSHLDTERVVQLFRAANIAIARTLLGDAPGTAKYLGEYADRAEAFGCELQFRYHRQHRK